MYGDLESIYILLILDSVQNWIVEEVASEQDWCQNIVLTLRLERREGLQELFLEVKPQTAKVLVVCGEEVVVGYSSLAYAIVL